jgi:hypothetical protein
MGPESIGVSVRTYTGEAFEPDSGVVLSGNAIGQFVTAVQMQ